jgi:hypothetical protein
MRKRAKVGGLLAAALAVTVVLLFVIPSSASAATIKPGQTLEVAKCTANTAQSQTYRAPAASANAKLLVDVKWTVKNDLDSGVVPASWAFDYYSSTLYVWKLQAGPHAGTIYYILTVSGTFTSLPGLLSPQNGVTEGAIATGTLNGGLNGTIIGGTLNLSAKLSGFIGTKDYGGSITTIGVASYAPSDFNANGGSYWNTWARMYFGIPATEDFTNVTTTSYDFIYHVSALPGETVAHGTWCNDNLGDAGDIVVS